jgi:tRNA pseudouridine-54 N-methylase
MRDLPGKASSLDLARRRSMAKVVIDASILVPLRSAENSRVVIRAMGRHGSYVTRDRTGAVRRLLEALRETDRGTACVLREKTMNHRAAIRKLSERIILAWDAMDTLPLICKEIEAEFIITR